MTTVQITVTSPERAAALVPAHHFPLPEGSAFRAVSLLAIVPCGDGRLVASGQTRIVTGRGVQSRLDVVVRALWSAPSLATSDAARAPEDWRSIIDHPELVSLIKAELDTRGRTSLGRVPFGRTEAAATILARRLAERSRDNVAALREMRYTLENLLADAVRGQGGQKLEAILAGIVEVSAMCGRAGDEARESAREGTWVWRSDSAAFHAHRRLVDPNTVVLQRQRLGRLRPWFVNLDAGVRHCRQMETLAGREI